MKIRKQHCKSCGSYWTGVHRRCVKCGKPIKVEEDEHHDIKISLEEKNRINEWRTHIQPGT